VSKNLKKVCYYTTYRQPQYGSFPKLPEEVDYRLCTHIVFTFANVVSNQELTFEGEGRQTFTYVYVPASF